MKPRGANQPTNLGQKVHSQNADLDDQLFAAMQQWDDNGDNTLGFIEEDDCLMEGGGTPQ